MAWGEIIDSGNSHSEAEPGQNIGTWARVKNHGIIPHPYKVTCTVGQETYELTKTIGPLGTKFFPFYWTMPDQDTTVHLRVYHRQDSEWIYDAEDILLPVLVITPPEPPPGIEPTELSIRVTDGLGNDRDTFFEWENVIVWGKITVAGTTEVAPSCNIEVWADMTGPIQEPLTGTDISDDDGDYRVQFNAGTLPLTFPIYISAVFNGNESYGSSKSGTVIVTVNPAEPPVAGQPYVRVVSYSWSQEDIPNRDPVTVGIPVEVRIIVRNDGELPGDCRAAIYEYGGSILATTGGLTLAPNQDEIVTTTFVPTLPNYTYDIGLVGQHFEFEV